MNVIFWLVLAVMLLGTVGTMLPVIPGTPLIFVAALGYGWYNGFRQITPVLLGVMFLLMVFSLVIDYLAGSIGAKKYGATKYGTWGAFIGGVVGVILLNIPGLLLGPFLGAVIGEVASGRNVNEAVKVGFGTVVGLAGGAFVKLIFALGMVGMFVIYAI